MIDHVTFQVPKGKIHYSSIDEFFAALNFLEVEPDEAIEKDWVVRWFAPREMVGVDGDIGCIVHLVEPKKVAMNDNSDGEVNLQLGHFCCTVPFEKYDDLCDSPLLEHATPGSSRIWAKGPFGLRAEVRLADTATPEPVLVEVERKVRAGATGATIVEAASKLGKALGRQDSTSERDPYQYHQDILDEAMGTYKERNELYRDNWKRMGLKGMVFRIRERAERVWDATFGKKRELVHLPEDYSATRDDLIDQINFCVFAVRAIDEDNLNGDWFDA